MIGFSRIGAPFEKRRKLLKIRLIQINAYDVFGTLFPKRKTRMDPIIFNFFSHSRSNDTIDPPQIEMGFFKTLFRYEKISQTIENKTLADKTSLNAASIKELRHCKLFTTTGHSRVFRSFRKPNSLLSLPTYERE